MRVMCRIKTDLRKVRSGFSFHFACSGISFSVVCRLFFLMLCFFSVAVSVLPSPFILCLCLAVFFQSSSKRLFVVASLQPPQSRFCLTVTAYFFLCHRVYLSYCFFPLLVLFIDGQSVCLSYRLCLFPVSVACRIQSIFSLSLTPCVIADHLSSSLSLSVCSFPLSLLSFSISCHCISLYYCFLSLSQGFRSP